ncbi:MAG TPA: hypothetical protein DCY20_01370 [Firmicutes bacterium]|nr:hypothetical protein [Bacillota bacterium]
MKYENMRNATIPPVAPPGGEELEGISTSSTKNSGPFFIPFILMLDPLEFYVVGVVIAIILSLELRPAEQDALGTFIELIGFGLSTIATQGLYLEALAAQEEAKVAAEEQKKLQNEVATLKKEVAELKALLLSTAE